MSFNPQIHHRKSIRLKGYDYSSNGVYFITINCQDKIHRFGIIAGAGLASAHIILSNYGVIAQEEWQNLPLRFPNIELGAVQIMPDHMHGIIIIKNDLAKAILGEGASSNGVLGEEENENKDANKNIADAILGEGASSEGTLGAEASPARTIGDIVCAYKSIVANECLKIAKSKNEQLGKFWQRNYYERIFRNERAVDLVSRYIENNPMKWKGK